MEMSLTVHDIVATEVLLADDLDMEVPEYTGVDAESTGHAKTNCRQHAPVAKDGE